MTTWLKFTDLANARGDPQFVYVTKTTAIQCARESAEASNHFNATDKQLLDNFKAVNWATEIELDELP